MASFPNIGALAAHFERAAMRLPAEIHAALTERAIDVRQIAYEKIGGYQAAAESPQGAEFPGWSELADATKEDRVQQGYSPDDPLLRSGGFAETITSDIQPSQFTVGSADPRAEWFEQGTSRMPPRPSIGPAMAQSMDATNDRMAEAIVRAMKA
jgi:hypothetical protein